MSLLIRNGTIVTAVDRYVGDIFVEKETITAIGTALPMAADRIIDASGKYVFPGGIDVHTHLDMPFGGTRSADDFESGTIAAAHGGTWNAAAWVTRTDAAVPTEVLSAAFGMPKSAAVQREIIALASGGQAVIALSSVEPGQPTAMTQDERDQRQRQLAEQAARAELTGYAGNVRDQATVRIPAEILEPPLF